MDKLASDIIFLYMNYGVIGLIIIGGAILLIWWVVKGRKPGHELQKQVIEVLAKNGTFINRCTDVIEQLGSVIEDNTSERREIKECMVRFEDHMTKQGTLLNEIHKNQVLCLDRQKRRTD